MTDIKICLPDSGVDTYNVNLQGRMISPVTFLNGVKTNNIIDNAGHGTFMAGIITQYSDAMIIPCRFMDSTGTGQLSDLLLCLDYCAENKANIINCSFGTTIYSVFLQLAIVRLSELNITVVAASGNYNIDIDVFPIYPASFSRNHSNIISVGALDRHLNKLGTSDFGKLCVQEYRVGDNITNFGPNNKLLSASGTSVSCAFVTASYAKILGK